MVICLASVFDEVLKDGIKICRIKLLFLGPPIEGHLGYLEEVTKHMPCNFNQHVLASAISVAPALWLDGLITIFKIVHVSK